MSLTSEPGDRLAAFGNQLVDVHIWLREELSRLREDVDSFLSGDSGRPRNLRAHCLAFCTALTRHHTAEDQGVFPVLAETFPALRPVLDELARDHEQVEEILLRLQGLLDGLPTGDAESGAARDPAEVRRVRGELDGLIALVESHFTYEEKKLVAALNELGTPLPDDFRLSDLTGR
ncbi:hemerythrin domain-containing protein [Streptomyces sp. NBC_00094]|uniref:hemerythrin domain-containing protein n=1 Tax=Streptomyces sp. NBC_00094 TaxID=2903620 RepID=UPI002253AD7D|nr:hemerythrin domain-containing protein [Streptomyces sp. NBC_00094]MCX5395152.1 hemerythrin domain-containing protein [Streptomyces sp. NBC_00094]